MRSEPSDFVTTNTIIENPALTPEIALHLATEVTPLWFATADTLATSGAEPPFWAFAWPGGQALARYVLDHPNIVKERQVLDIATGSGIVAIAAAKSGAATITANDVDPLSLAAVDLNAKLNSVSVSTSSKDLTNCPPPQNWDVVLAGDIFYDREMTARFSPWLRARAAAGALVLVGDPDRAYCPTDNIERLATYNVATSLDLESSKMLTTTIWQIVD